MNYYRPTNTPPGIPQDDNILPYAEFREHIAILQKGNEEFKNFSELARSHKSIALYALKVDFDNVYHLGLDAYNNFEVLSYILKTDIDIFGEIVHKITNKNIFFDLVKIDHDILTFANKNTLKDKEKMLKFIKKNNKSIKYVNNLLFNDMDFIKGLLSINGLFIKGLTSEMKNNKELAILAIKGECPYKLQDSYDGGKVKSAYSYISKKLKQDKDIIKLIDDISEENSGF